MSRAQVGDSDAFGERPRRTVEVFTRGEGISVGGAFQNERSYYRGRA